eukprot:3929328-Pyramimonas_sp.AAC.2
MVGPRGGTAPTTWQEAMRPLRTCAQDLLAEELSNISLREDGASSSRSIVSPIDLYSVLEALLSTAGLTNDPYDEQVFKRFPLGSDVLIHPVETPMVTHVSNDLELVARAVICNCRSAQTEPRYDLACRHRTPVGCR